MSDVQEEPEWSPGNRIPTRLEVGHPEWGLIETFPTRVQALEFAVQYATREPGAERVEVYDVMARPGRPRLWRYADGNMMYVEEEPPQ